MNDSDGTIHVHASAVEVPTSSSMYMCVLLAPDLSAWSPFEQIGWQIEWMDGLFCPNQSRVLAWGACVRVEMLSHVENTLVYRRA